jgi:hypothetical protein
LGAFACEFALKGAADCFGFGILTVEKHFKFIEIVVVIGFDSNEGESVLVLLLEDVIEMA